MNYIISKVSQSLLLILLLLVLQSCDFNPFKSDDDIWDDKVYTISELFGNEIAQDEHTYLVKGFIFELNYSLEGEDFLLYPEINVSRDVTYHNIHIDVMSSKILFSIRSSMLLRILMKNGFLLLSEEKQKKSQFTVMVGQMIYLL